MDKYYIPTYLLARRSHPNLIVSVLASAEPRRVINIKWVWCGSSHGKHIYNLDRSSLAGLGD